MEQLSDEITSTFVEEQAIDIAKVANLSYLNAVINESLRLYPPGPNAQPRITPPEGNTILGENLPGNVSTHI